jgi:hypothetical protein
VAAGSAGAAAGKAADHLGPVIGGVLIGMKLTMPALFACAAIPSACCAVAVFALRKTVEARGIAVSESQHEIRIGKDCADRPTINS